MRDRGPLRLFLRHKLAVFGAVIVCLSLASAVLARDLTVNTPNAQDLAHNLAVPSSAHPFGTDQLGRDLLSRVLFGGQVSMEVAFGSVGLAILIGVALGALAGYRGGATDNLLMRLVDAMMTIPAIVLAIAILSVLGPGIESSVIAIGATMAPIFARLTRSVVLTMVQLDYVEAARSLGASHLRIVVRHLLPNAVAPLIVQASVGAGTSILTEAALSFLGLGVRPPTPEWGAMLADGRNYLTIAPHLVFFPGLAIALLVLGFNLLGDGLRDVLDPRLAHFMN